MVFLFFSFFSSCDCLFFRFHCVYLLLKIDWGVEIFPYIYGRMKNGLGFLLLFSFRCFFFHFFIWFRSVKPTQTLKQKEKKTIGGGRRGDLVDKTIFIEPIESNWTSNQLMYLLAWLLQWQQTAAYILPKTVMFPMYLLPFPINESRTDRHTNVGTNTSDFYLKIVPLWLKIFRIDLF